MRLFKSMYGLTNSGKLFAVELKEWLLEAGFIQSQCQMSICYKYAPDGSKIVVLYYFYDCVYGIQMKVLENGLLILWEIDSMRNSWDMHIGSCQ